MDESGSDQQGEVACSAQGVTTDANEVIRGERCTEAKLTHRDTHDVIDDVFQDLHT